MRSARFFRSSALVLALALCGAAAGRGATLAERALVQELDKLTGGDWQPWFERYVYGTEIPKLPKQLPKP